MPAFLDQIVAATRLKVVETRRSADLRVTIDSSGWLRRLRNRYKGGAQKRDDESKLPETPFRVPHRGVPQ